VRRRKQEINRLENSRKNDVRKANPAPGPMYAEASGVLRSDRKMKLRAKVPACAAVFLRGPPKLGTG